MTTIIIWTLLLAPATVGDPSTVLGSYDNVTACYAASGALAANVRGSHTTCEKSLLRIASRF
jgi:hypothetical protein